MVNVYVKYYFLTAILSNKQELIFFFLFQVSVHHVFIRLNRVSLLLNSVIYNLIKKVPVIKFFFSDFYFLTNLIPFPINAIDDSVDDGETNNHPQSQ